MIYINMSGAPDETHLERYIVTNLKQCRSRYYKIKRTKTEQKINKKAHTFIENNMVIL